MVTHQSTLHHVEIPVPKGIHSVEQIWHSNTTETTVTEAQCPTLDANCHTGVVFDNQVFCSCSGHLVSNDKSTINSTFCIFIKQLCNSDLQKMVIQFTIQFTPNMVCTLNNKIKHSVH